MERTSREPLLEALPMCQDLSRQDPAIAVFAARYGEAHADSKTTAGAIPAGIPFSVGYTYHSSIAAQAFMANGNPHRCAELA